MIASTIFQQLSMKIFLFIMTLFYSVNGALVPPSTDNTIDADATGAQLVFATVADPQVSNYMFDRYATFLEASADLHNAKGLDAIVGLGDIAENGLAEEYQLVYDALSGIDTEYIMATGNHDIRLRAFSQSESRFLKFANALNGNEELTSSHYVKEINGYKIIVLGTEKMVFEEAYLSDAQLEWLDSELTAANGKPAFVVCHQPLKDTHNIDVAWNSIVEGAGSVGPQSDALRAIVEKHSNVFLLTGHLHMAFCEYSYEQFDGDSHGINVPSFSIENKDGDYNKGGTSYIVEVYEDEVIFRARDHELGIWVPEYNIVVNVA